jgi:pimeloyl-ACP methyl ester carboxylesterase
MAVVAWAHARRRQVRDRLAAVALCNVGVEDLVRRSTVIPFPAALATARTAIGQRVLTVPLPLPHRAKPALSHLIRALVLGPAASPTQAAFCAEMLLATPADVRAACGATLSALHLAHGLPALTAPTVVVAGEHDRLTPAAYARIIAQALPRATFVELAGIGHMTPIEAPGEVSAVIRGLAARHLGARRPPEETHPPPP